MKIFARDVDYAVRALTEMAKTKERVSVVELSKELNIPQPFLRKILQILSGQGLVHSLKGNGGGFQLAVPLKKIFLKDLFEIFHESTTTMGKSSLNCPSCSNFHHCRMRQKINDIERRVVAELATISVASLSD